MSNINPFIPKLNQVEIKILNMNIFKQNDVDKQLIILFNENLSFLELFCHDAIWRQWGSVSVDAKWSQFENLLG